MDALEAILTRRSIRAYTDQPVARETVNELLEAAQAAPSASNQQPWHFIVITERGILNEIPTYHPYSQMLRRAPLAIAVCADPGLEVSKGYWVQDCSAAAQNILLAAHARGLGAVWLGVYPLPDRIAALQRTLALPQEVIPLCLIAIGHPAEKKPRANRFNPARVHQNRWEQKA